MAIVDPELACSVSPHSTAITGMDVLAHAVEAYLSARCTPRTEMLALESIRLLAYWLPRACENGSDIDARTGMAAACNWAGLATVDASPHLGHRMAEGFVCEKPLPHGLPCAWATPEVIAFLDGYLPAKVKRIGEAMGISFPDGISTQGAGNTVAQRVRKLMKEVGIRSPKEMGADREVALENMGILAAPMLGCPANITPETARSLMEKAYDNYV